MNRLGFFVYLFTGVNYSVKNIHHLPIVHALRGQLHDAGHNTNVGDEGGFAPRLKTHLEVLEILAASIKEAGYEGKVRLALDCAASEYYKDGKYTLEGKALTSAEIAEVYAGWAAKHGIVSIEDPLWEDDWSGWKDMTATIGDRLRLIGDDLFVTNPEILKKGIKAKCANSILIKLNQIGTVSETLETIELAKTVSYTNVISHRSGETEDVFIADLAVATNAGQIKTGSLSRTDRVAKYNQLLRIEEDLAGSSLYPGRKVFQRFLND